MAGVHQLESSHEVERREIVLKLAEGAIFHPSMATARFLTFIRSRVYQMVRRVYSVPTTKDILYIYEGEGAELIYPIYVQPST